MKIEWIYNEENNCHLKTFLKQKGVSRRLSAKIRHEGGQLLVNNTSGRIVDQIKKGDKIKVTGSSYSIYGASRLWTIFVSHVYNKETDSFDEFNKFVSVGLELGCSKEDRALY